MVGNVENYVSTWNPPGMSREERPIEKPIQWQLATRVSSEQSSSTCIVKGQGPPGKRKQEKIKRSTFTRSRGTCQDINNSLEPLIFVTVSEMNDLLRVG